MEKRNGLAAIVLAIMPGLGHLYLGCMKRAILLFVVDMFALYEFIMPHLVDGITASDYSSAQWGIVFVVLAMIWIANMVDVRRELSESVQTEE